MKWLVLMTFVCMGSSVTNAYLKECEFGAEFLTASKIWNYKCVYITGVSQKQIATLRNGVFDDNDKQMKSYQLCLMLLTDAIDCSNMTINKEFFTKYMPKQLTEGVKNYVECWEESKQKDGECNCRKNIWNMLKCVQKRDPPNFIIF